MKIEYIKELLVSLKSQEQEHLRLSNQSAGGIQILEHLISKEKNDCPKKDGKKT